ncbi:MAG TPA: glycosyltransferase [Candidatus Dormibacteraeota bacterium]|jgi:glycosyltransferase involved in cell wall biosynthesis|nr:glycosyltransferase [Candidatus Dormibacteraeota bacterium]
MRLTLVAPLVAPLRAAQTGGTQAMVADLARGLVARGEQVELVVPRGSSVPGVRLRRAPGGPYGAELVHPSGEGVPTAERRDGWPSAQAAAYLRIASDLRAAPPDVVHAHALDWASFYALAAAGLPSVHTLHLGPLDPAAAAAARAAAVAGPRPRFVAVSRSCAGLWRGIVPVDAVIGNGVDPASVPFSARPQPDLAIVAGRIAPEKGTHLALAAARRAGMRVLLAGEVYDRAYFEEQVAPLIDGGVEHAGHVSRRRLGILYGRAAVALVASLWEEPFGMVAVEANLAGTPVAGFARGALPYVVGEQGGVLSDEATAAALARAIPRAVALDRGSVRRAAARRHSLDRMLDRYQRLYAQVAGEASR